MSFINFTKEKLKTEMKKKKKRDKSFSQLFNPLNTNKIKKKRENAD